MNLRRKASSLGLVVTVTAVFGYTVASIVDSQTQEANNVLPRKVAQIQTQQAAAGLLRYSGREVFKSYKTDRTKLKDGKMGDLPPPTDFAPAYLSSRIKWDSCQIKLSDLSSQDVTRRVLPTATNRSDVYREQSMSAREVTAYVKTASEDIPDVVTYGRIKYLVRALSFLDYAYFYNQDLEIYSSTKTDIYGPIHVNGNIYLEAGSDLTFHGKLNASGDIYVGRLKSLNGDNTSLTGNVLADDDLGRPISGYQTVNGTYDPTKPKTFEQWKSETKQRVQNRVQPIPLEGTSPDNQGNQAYLTIQPIRGPIPGITGNPYNSDEQIVFQARSGLNFRLTGEARNESVPKHASTVVKKDANGNNYTVYNGVRNDYVANTLKIDAFYYQRDAAGNLILDGENKPVEVPVKIPAGIIGDANQHMTAIEKDLAVEEYDEMSLIKVGEDPSGKFAARKSNLGAKTKEWFNSATSSYTVITAPTTYNSSTVLFPTSVSQLSLVEYKDHTSAAHKSDYIIETPYKPTTVNVADGTVTYARYTENATYTIPTRVTYTVEARQFKTRDANEIRALGKTPVVEVDNRDAGGTVTYKEETFVYPTLASVPALITGRTSVTTQSTPTVDLATYDLSVGAIYPPTGQKITKTTYSNNLSNQLRKRTDKKSYWTNEKIITDSTTTLKTTDPAPSWYTTTTGSKTVNTSKQSKDPVTGHFFYAKQGASTYLEYGATWEYTYVVGGLEDPREGQSMDITYIDIGKLKQAVEGDGTAWKSHAGTDAAGKQEYNPASNWNGIVYIEVPTSDEPDIRPIYNEDGDLEKTIEVYPPKYKHLGVALINAKDVPSRGVDENGSPLGFTLATNAPTYVIGDLNADGLNLGPQAATTPDDASEPPTMIAAEAVTLLSKSWGSDPTKPYLTFNERDINGNQRSLENIPFGSSTKAPYESVFEATYKDKNTSWFGARMDNSDSAPTAADASIGSRSELVASQYVSKDKTVPSGSSTEISAAFVTGVTPTTQGVTSAGSGGAHNIFRFIEDWQTKPGNTIYSRTSVVVLFEPEAHNTKLPTANQERIYTPPSRATGYNDMFSTRVPPGTPKAQRFTSYQMEFISKAEYEAATQ